MVGLQNEQNKAFQKWLKVEESIQLSSQVNLANFQFSSLFCEIRRLKININIGANMISTDGEYEWQFNRKPSYVKFIHNYAFCADTYNAFSSQFVFLPQVLIT